MSSRHTIEASVIIVSYNTRDILRRCLQSLYAAIGSRAIEVIVVENASRDASADMVEQEFPHAQLVRSVANLGFAAANNVGFKLAQGHYVILLNPDAEVASGALDNAIRCMEASPRIGLAGGRLVDFDGRDQPSARRFPSLLNEVLVISGLAARFPQSRLFGRFDRTWADPGQAAQVDWVPGAFAIIRHDALRAVGPFDERFFLYYEEVDLCRRFQAIHHPLWRPGARVDVANDAPRETSTQIWCADSHRQLIKAANRDDGKTGQRQRGASQSGDLTRHSEHAQAMRQIGREFEGEKGIVQVQMLANILTQHCRSAEFYQAAVIFRELELTG